MVVFAPSAEDVRLAIVELEAVDELGMANEDEELELWMDDELEVLGLGLGVGDAEVGGRGGVEVTVSILIATYVVVGCGGDVGGGGGGGAWAVVGEEDASLNHQVAWNIPSEVGSNCVKRPSSTDLIVSRSRT